MAHKPCDQYISIKALRTTIGLNQQAQTLAAGKTERQTEVKGQRPLMRAGTRPNPSASQYHSNLLCNDIHRNLID